MATGSTAEIGFACEGDGSLRIRLSGPWQLRTGVPSLGLVERELASASARRIVFDATGLTGWDTSLLTFLTRVTQLCAQRGITADRHGLPAGVERLLALAEAVPERVGARGAEVDESMLERIGKAKLSTTQSLSEMLRFIGEATLAVWRFLLRRARYRRAPGPVRTGVGAGR